MNVRLVLGGVVAAVALGAVGVGVAVAQSGGSGGSSSGGTTAGGSVYGRPPAGTTPSPSGTTVTTAPTSLGRTLVDGAGRTLYLFESDTPKTSTCYGSCASIWPPVDAATAPHAAGGASAALLGALHRSDGKTQLTYKGHPLYYYAGDAKPGDTAGQGLLQFGAKWYVLAPGGDKIDED